MPLDFPSSPTNGQVYQQYVYDASLPGWRSKGGAVAATYTSDTAPSGAVKGDMWYRTSDGTTYVYVVDADTSQWVEIRSEISTSRVGLVPIVPSSVFVNSGSASIAANGNITFTSVVGFGMTGAFTSAYANYKVVFVINPTNATGLLARYVPATSYTTDQAYYQGGYLVTHTGSASTYYTGPQYHHDLGYFNGPTSDNRGAGTIEVQSPALVSNTTYQATLTGQNANGVSWYTTAGFYDTDTAMTGMYLYTSSGGAFSGTVKIYGYN